MGSYTTKLNLYKPAVGETGWGALVNTNFDTIDGITPAQIGAEPAFTKNGAFNKNFGTESGTVCQGNDSRLSNSRTPTAHASTATTYGVSDASNYGHAKASGTTPKAAGTAAVGSETSSFARGDHVHPAQTTVSGNAGSATKLATARTIGISGGATGTATSFNGSANITIPVTALDASKLSAGTVPAARLPAATTSALGAVKVGSGLKVSSGTLSVDSSAITQRYTCTPRAGTDRYITLSNDMLYYAHYSFASYTANSNSPSVYMFHGITSGSLKFIYKGSSGTSETMNYYTINPDLTLNLYSNISVSKSGTTINFTDIIGLGLGIYNIDICMFDITPVS